MLLPALAKARESARKVVCMNNLKQIYNMSCMFEGEHNALMPQWYYAHHPNGRQGEDTYGIGSKFGWSYSHFGHMLMDLGYLDENNREKNSTYASREKLATRSILACPEGYAPTSGADDAISDPAVYGNRDVYSRFMNKMNGYIDNGVPCDQCDAGNFMSAVGTSESYLTSYQINMAAGSFCWYHGIISNGSNYKVRHWYNRARLHEIGYIFESNYTLMNNNHTKDLYSTTFNSWNPVSPATSAPTAPHNSRTVAQFVYANGQIGELTGFYYDTAMGSRPWPFIWK
jgi:hypothetical protein